MKISIYLKLLAVLIMLSGLNAKAQSYVVNFEGAGEVKAGYASGTVNLSGIDWNMTECMIGGSEAGDWKNGLHSARMRGYAASAMTMLENKSGGLGTLSFSYRRYGTDVQVDWKAEYSTDDGATWTQMGSTFTPPASTDPSTFSETVNVTGDVRIRIKRATETGSANRRLNIDDITLTDYSGGGNAAPSISNIAHNPSTIITPATTVNVSADVTDSDGTIASVQLNWGTASGNLPNTISMTLGLAPQYTSSTAIPAQADGTTVYYSVTATDNLGAVSTSAEYSYGVFDPAVKLAFEGFPASGSHGAGISSFTVKALRSDNSLDGSYAGEISLSKASGPGAVSGSLAQNAVAGVATFNNVQFDQPGTYSLYADAAGLTQATSPDIVISSGPTLTDVIVPQYIQGVNGTNNNRVPFAYRLSIANLNPSTTYRYINQMIVASEASNSNGAGNAIYVNSDGSFTRTTNASMSTAGGYGEFTTDASGSFTGWFITEPTANATRFTPGLEIYARIQLNDGNNGTATVTRLTSASAIKVINFGTTADANQGTAIRAESGAQPKNFVFLYDNTAGTGRPIYGTSIEITGEPYTATSWAAFYRNNVAGNNGAWGGIIPNVNDNGVRLIEERKLSDGTVASSSTSADGIWDGANTVNPTGGTDSVIVLNLNSTPTLTVNPLILSGFTYTEGEGPSTTQSFTVSGSMLTSNVVIQTATHYEISLINSPSFEASSQINLPVSGGMLSNTTIYVRLKSGLAAGAYDNEPLYVASSGAEGITVNLSGNVTAGVTEPTAHATAFAATALDHSQIKLDWTDAIPPAGNYLIKGSATGFSDIANPADGIAEANGALVRNVASGAGTYTFTGLDQSTTYYFKIFPYNGTGVQVNYKTDGTVPQASAATLSGPTLTDVIVPQYIQGVNGTNNNRVPFACRLSIANLNPSTTYRYINQMIVASEASNSNGAGNAIYVNSDGSFTRTTNASMSTAGGYGEFTTDASGSFTGWFITEPTANAARFTPGFEIYARIQLNDGNNGTATVTRLTSASAIKVINFGTTADANQGTAIRAESGAQPRNFVFLYDNTAGTGRPIYGTSIEITGEPYTATSWAAFYRNNVAGNNGAWGGIIPNVNDNGVRLIEERKLSDGTVASTLTSADGIWDGANTVNPTGGISSVIVLNLNFVPTLTVNPLSLSGFTYAEGQGPSASQSFVMSGSHLISVAVVQSAPDFEISFTNSPFAPTSQINLPAPGGTLPNTTIYVRLKAGLAAGAYLNEPLYVASSGAEGIAVNLSGNVTAGVTEPTAHATAFAATALDHSQIKLGWTDAIPPAGNYLIKGSATGFSDIANPADGIAEANGALVRNVASGAGTYTFTGLDQSTTYYFKIFPYNGTGVQVNYKTDGSVPQASAATPAGPQMSEVILPTHLIGSPVRLPYAFRVSFSGLLPDATYKYINQAVNDSDGPTSGGAGNAIYVAADGEFNRTTAASFTNAAQHGEFTTDANGAYIGWFMIEPTTNARFNPGGDVFMRIRLNNGAGGTSAVSYFTTTAVKVIGFGAEANENQGTALRATSSFAAGNFVFLYGEPQQSLTTAANAQPVAGTAIESTGIDFSTTTAYPAWFRNSVAGNDGAFGTVVPNVLPNGLTRIDEYSNLTGNLVTSKTSDNGYWGNTNTVNPTGGADQVLVLDLDLSPALTVLPNSLSGFEYFIGQGPSEQQSFTVSGAYLSGSVSIAAPSAFELSLSNGNQFVAQNPIVLPQTAGILDSTVVYARLKAGLAGGNYVQQVTITSPDADQKAVELSGYVSLPADEPQNHAASFALAANGMNAATATWVDAIPAAAGYLIKGSAVGYNAITAPVDGIVETESQLVKYVAAGQQTAAFTGLEPDTKYYFKLFAYNGSNIAINYKTDGAIPQADVTTQGSPSLTNLIVPQYIQGVNGTNNNRVPYAFRIELKNLLPNSTYRYTNQAVNAADGPTAAGAGNPIYVLGNAFYRSTSPGFVAEGQYGSFTTDASGSYEGWFMLEATGNARFTAGQQVFMRIRLNNGQGGTTASHYFTTEGITVLNYSTEAGAANATAIRATSSASPKNFAFIYDNVSGSGRPLYGTNIETTGLDFSATSWAAFYRNNVAGTIGAWGGIVPNNNPLGVRRVEERSLTNGNIVSERTSSDGYWGLTSTTNPTGGLTDIIVLDLVGQSSNNKIAGQLKYFNAQESPMPVNNPQSVFYVQLFENGVAVKPRRLVSYNAESGLDAYFEFGNIEAGRSYTLRVWEQVQNNKLGSIWSFNNWGGVSAVDALILSFMSTENPVVGQLPWLMADGGSAFSPHFFNVADANNSQTLTAVDALLLQHRMTSPEAYNPLPGGRHNFQLAAAGVPAHHVLSYPQAPAIPFEPHGVYDENSAADQLYYEAILPAIETGTNIFNVYYTAIGDLNASYVPGSGLRSSSAMEIDGQINTSPNGLIRIPVVAAESFEMAAMSLELRYNSQLLDVIDLETQGVYSINNETIRISWFDRDGRHVEAGEAIAYVLAKPHMALNQNLTALELGNNTEFADRNAGIIEGIQLKTPGIAIINASDNAGLQAVAYPNPFSNLTNLSIDIVQAGLTSLEVYNMTGQVVYRFESAYGEGKQIIPIEAAQIGKPGIYFYRIIHIASSQTSLAKGTLLMQ